MRWEQKGLGVWVAASCLGPVPGTDGQHRGGGATPLASTPSAAPGTHCVPEITLTSAGGFFRKAN